jgi:hypothetical protein
VEAKVYNLAGTVLDDQTASNISLAGQQVATSVLGRVSEVDRGAARC